MRIEHLALRKTLHVCFVSVAKQKSRKAGYSMKYYIRKVVETFDQRVRSEYVELRKTH